ncbi:RNA-binding protein RO60 [Notothenia coriiceps]|uniref:RNA-binding protein RO60 n=1 Tax=Notothenia coriiceps TaxID=8208 RepID=A0A6I9N505_9TELE|nr:PREDICTED: 60 kDa SS-A/Ro ribonucleoprotein [Notothenia coriiceps]
MPLQSVLKILGKMTSNKVLEPGSSDTQALCDRFQSQTALTKAKIHPFHIFLSSENYKRDQGHQGKTKWEPDSSILKAMDSAFYKSFMNVEPVAKRFVVAVDVSTSLSSVVPGTSISTAVAAAAIAMVTLYKKIQRRCESPRPTYVRASGPLKAAAHPEKSRVPNPEARFQCVL